MAVPNTLRPDQDEILITLRALAGLVAQALRRKAGLNLAEAAEAPQRLEQASADLLFWRDLLLYHTRRLLPLLRPTAGLRDYRRFAEELVRDVYLEDQEAIADHGCDPLTCTHPAHPALPRHE